MNLLRRGVVWVLSLILLLTLLGAASAFSVNRAIGTPDNIKKWLSESKLYDHVVDSLVDQAQKSGSQNQSDPTSVAITDPGVKEALAKAFPPAQLNTYVSGFLDANYAWLEGKVAKPSFSIDLTSAKQNFAVEVGQAVEAHLVSIPVCSVAQLASLQTQDPLLITCRPANLSPAAAGAEVTANLTSGDGPLSQSVITADTFGKDSGQSGGQAYYQKLSIAPKAYQWGVKAPWILALVALLSAVGIIFIAPLKRKGLRRIGLITLEAGAVIIATKFVADFGFQQLEKRVFNQTDVGPIQQSLTDFLHRLETFLTHTSLYFGIAYAVLGVVILVVLTTTRKRQTKPSKEPVEVPATDEPKGTPTDEPKPSGRAIPVAGGTPSTRPVGTAPTVPRGSKPPKRPRLIQ